jgi:SAM-dependent methyltransferase
MKKALLDLLICPACLPEQSRLQETVQEERQNDIVAGSLRCPCCRQEVPIEEGVAFLCPDQEKTIPSLSKYETPSVVSSYLWSHYGDLLGEPEALAAYSEWAGLLKNRGSFALDVGAAVGRFTFEMSRRSDLAIGIDRSVSFVRTARELMLRRRKEVALRQEGLLTRQITIDLPAEWDSRRVEFIVGDAQALPFRSGTFTSLASLNVLDKVPRPLRHLQEMNRVARSEGAQMLCSDPFSWSEEVAPEEYWLGGTARGPFAGYGLDNVAALLQDGREQLGPPWQIASQGHVWWKIRTHANHFELIRSRYLKAERKRSPK